jgi:hypothetical protein
VHDCIESGGNDERGGCDGHERGHGGCDGFVESALMLSESRGEEAASEHLVTVSAEV